MAFAGVAKLVDALVLGTSGAIRGGSSPLPGTHAKTTRDFLWLFLCAELAWGGLEKVVEILKEFHTT